MSSNKIVGTPDLVKTFNWSPTNPQWSEPSASLFEDGYSGGDKALASNVNFIYKEFGEKINHVLQNGIPKWVTSKSYLIGDVVNNDGRIYQAIANNSSSEPTEVNTDWVYIIQSTEFDASLGRITAAENNINTNTSNIASNTSSILTLGSRATALEDVKNPTTAGNALKIPRVNSSATAYELVSGVVGAFARVNFDQTVAANLTGTFSRAGTLVTGVVTAHGMRTGHRIRAKHNENGSIDGEYTITVLNANTFTYNTGTSGTIASNTLTLPRFAINSSIRNYNVAFVANTEQGWTAIVNYIDPLPDIYAVNAYTATKASGVNAFSLTNSRLLTAQTPNVNYIYLENYIGDFSGQNQCNQCGLSVN
jgi:hypothetical protein